MTIRLQLCRECGTVNYPARQVCRHCLSDALAETDDAGTGELLATGRIYRSFEPAYDPLLPLRIGTVKLDCGWPVICFLSDDMSPGERVRLRTGNNAQNQTIWWASPQ
jgi:uncharacterized protein